MAEIDRDLVRWKRSRWLGVTAFFFVLQVGAFFAGSQKRLAPREIYPREPVLSIAEQSRNMDRNDFENPFLFAGASWNGFSADAWLRTPEWRPPRTGLPVPVRFLSYGEARKPATLTQSEPLEFTPRQRPAVALPAPRQVPRTERISQLQLEGLQGRRLLNEPELPPQFHNDVLARTVVEALVSADGLVISTHILENSGSAKADADAVAIARRARFTPERGTNGSPDLVKLIFQWHALDLNQTNNPSTKVGR